MPTLEQITGYLARPVESTGPRKQGRSQEGVSVSEHSPKFRSDPPPPRFFFCPRILQSSSINLNVQTKIRYLLGTDLIFFYRWGVPFPEKYLWLRYSQSVQLATSGGQYFGCIVWLDCRSVPAHWKDVRMAAVVYVFVNGSAGAALSPSFSFLVFINSSLFSSHLGQTATRMKESCLKSVHSSHC